LSRLWDRAKLKNCWLGDGFVLTGIILMTTMSRIEVADTGSPAVTAAATFLAGLTDAAFSLTALAASDNRLLAGS
jgi:hypothetical protein